MAEKYIDKYLSIKNPSKEPVINLIKKIDIYEDKIIKLKKCLIITKI